MQKRFRAYDLTQVYLLPPSLRDWLPEDHLARFVAAVTSELDLSAIEAAYQRADGRGKPAYHPLLLVRLLVYGYALDGTRIAANASRQRTRRYERLTEKEQELAATVDKLLAEAQATDQQEDARYGAGRRDDELPPALATAERQLARIRAAKQELEREARERAEQAAREKAAQQGKSRDEAQRKRWQRARPTPDPEAKANLTDPDSRLMVDGATKAYVQGYMRRRRWMGRRG